MPHRPHPTGHPCHAEDIAVGALAAAVLSTVVQVLLWLAFTDAFPGILWRDARLTAALVLGQDVLTASRSFSMTAVMTVATGVHMVLSLAYAGAFCTLTRRLPDRRAVAAGGLLGALLYAVNLYGFTLPFPWFAAARGWITLAAHVAFGVAAVGGCRVMHRHRQGRP